LLSWRELYHTAGNIEREILGLFAQALVVAGEE
jgi:hypothetical protein